jgi:hypothetical protein
VTSLRLQPPSEAVYRLFGPVYQCAYCGDPADSIDHTTPRWFVSGNYELIKRYGLIKVHACRECNMLAGVKVDRTWPERKRRIAKALRKRYFKFLQAASWGEDELAELGPQLRKYVIQSDGVAEQVRKRLRVLDDRHWPHDVPTSLQFRLPDNFGQNSPPKP